MTFMFPVVVTGSGYSATNHTSKGEGSSLRFSSLRRAAEKTSNGPQKSSTSMSSKRTIPTRFLSNCFLLPLRRMNWSPPQRFRSYSLYAEVFPQFSIDGLKHQHCQYISQPFSNCGFLNLIIPCSLLQGLRIFPLPEGEG